MVRAARISETPVTRNGCRSPHPRNTNGCCDGGGQTWHNATWDATGKPGAPVMDYVTVCPNGCAINAWDGNWSA